MKTFIRLIPVAILATSASALADESINSKVEMRSKTVQFSRAVAQTEPGATALYKKLRSAAYDVCSGHEFPRGVAARTMLACSSAALDEAVVEVNVLASRR